LQSELAELRSFRRETAGFARLALARHGAVVDAISHVRPEASAGR